MPHLLPAWWWHSEELLAEFVRSPLFTPGLLARWAIQTTALTAAVWVSDFLAGAAVLRAAGRRWGGTLPPALRAAAALAIGSGLSGLVLFLLGAARMLKPQAPVLLAGVWALAGALAIHRMRSWRWALSFTRLFRIRRLTCWGWAAGILLAAVGILLVAEFLLPVTEFDSTMYHMRAARYYRETGSVAFNDNFRYNAHPHLPVLLYLRHWGIVGDDGAAKLFNLELLSMLVLVLVYAAREWRWRGGWVQGLLLIGSSPIFLYTAQLEYADLAVAAYLGVAAALMFHYLRRGGAVPLIAGGLALGFTGAVKLQGLVLAGCTCVGFTVAWLAARRGLAGLVRALALVAVLIALSGAGWWLRSWVHTGSPAYPFFAGANPDLQDTLLINRTYGLGRDWRAFVLLPWRMATGPARAFADAAVFGPAGLLLLAAAIAAVAVRRARPRPEILFLMVSWLAYLLFWFRTGQVMRYLAATLPVMALLWMWLLWRMGMGRRRAAVRVVAALMIVWTGYELLVTSMLFRRGVLPPVTRGQKEFALANTLPYYPAVAALNRRGAPSDHTYLMFCEECGYYVRTATSGDWHGAYPYRWLRMEGRSAAELAERLRKAGFRWVLVNRSDAAGKAGIFDWPYAESGFVRRNAPLPGATLVYDDAQYGVIRLW